MMSADDPVYYPTDPHPVRPGTSAALTARTIDATPPPPLVQAQETVAAAIPRITATIGSPLFLTTLGLTLVLVWMALRLRSRMLGLVLSAMLVMTLTSFRPVANPEQTPSVDDAVARDSEPSERFDRPKFESRMPEPAPYTFRVPRQPDVLRPDVERIRRDEEELREAIEELRERIEAELRRGARDPHQHYEYRSTRWIRKLPQPIREWAHAGRQTIVAWARDP